ncbi:bacteriocin biosynthesis cyclodehydratase domain-containing protein [Homoserinimonas aerilata]|uniref:Bacteriocin biosynthesis cyclodehydratase domain-containing protein n=1 Tax=Homoserinimonas aerilata TaxID=1162970 RepID=A0A542YH11_9MICO|nr:bacteriocin biosynthesis cyclodehydratase domain-containing protein [Homoserinimonas aerilata]
MPPTRTLQIDPRLSVVWRSPDCMQIGVDQPAAVLYGLSALEERLVSALLIGVTGPGLAMLAVEAGGEEHTAWSLVERIRPALRTQTARTVSGANVAVIGESLTARRIRHELGTAGIEARPALAHGATASEHPDLVVLVDHFVPDPDEHARWLRRDVPHLPVVLGDLGATVGPLVEPGRGPCLHCVQRHRADVDPLWATIAAQLWGRRSPTETPGFAAELAAITARAVLRRLQDGASEAAASVTIDADSGERVSRRWEQHPECGCASLPEIGSAPASRARPIRSAAAMTAPTTGAAIAAPA